MLRDRTLPPSRPILVATLLLALLPLPPAAPAGAQEAAPAPAKPSPLSVEEILVEPADPAPDTLCHLRIKLRNEGSATASELGFTVKVAGKELAPYKNQLFMLPVAAGGSAELKLYNFWSSESSRPAPADGKLSVEVTLNEARWVTVGMEEGVEVWTPGEAVPGLPVGRSVTLQMKKGG